MFFIFFGAMWLSIIGVITFAMYSAPTVSVNGQPVTADQFDAMLAPKLFLGIFWLVGIVFLVVGIRKLVIDTMTRVKGKLAIGMVVDILETGTYSNGRPEWKAKVMVAMEDGTLKEFSEVIGYDANKYSMGEYLEVKHYKKDINILGTTSPQRLPLRQQELFEEAKQRYGIGIGGGYGYPPNSGWNQGYGYNGAMNYGNNGYGNDGYGNSGYNNGGYGNSGYNNGAYNNGDNGYGANNGVKKVDENTVIINGVEYKRNN